MPTVVARDHGSRGVFHSVQSSWNGLVIPGWIGVWRGRNRDSDHGDIKNQQPDRDQFLPPGQSGPGQLEDSPGILETGRHVFLADVGPNWLFGHFLGALGQEHRHIEAERAAPPIVAMNSRRLMAP